MYLKVNPPLLKLNRIFELDIVFLSQKVLSQIFDFRAKTYIFEQEILFTESESFEPRINCLSRNSIFSQEKFLSQKFKPEIVFFVYKFYFWS